MSYTTISGIVTNLQVSRQFDDLILSGANKSALQTLAVGAACAGELLSAAMLSGGAGAADVEMDYFTCHVGDSEIFGKLMKVGFANGEVIEFVVERRQGKSFAVAARSPGRRITWMPPYTSRGNEAQLRHDIRWSILWSIGGVVFAALVDYFLIGPLRNAPLYYFACLYGGTFIATLWVNVSMRVKVYPHSRVATEILATFGYENPAAVDMNQIHNGLTHAFRRQPDGTFPPLLGLGAFRY